MQIQEGHAKRIDIVSDTHGHLSAELLEQIAGADLIVHAGDLTSEMDYEHLCCIAPVRAVLGNNDYYRDYGPPVRVRLRGAAFRRRSLSRGFARYRRGRCRVRPHASFQDREILRTPADQSRFRHAAARDKDAEYRASLCR